MKDVNDSVNRNQKDWEVSNAALSRMKTNFERGKGVKLSWEELEVFNRSLIGEWWNNIDETKQNEKS